MHSPFSTPSCKVGSSNPVMRLLHEVDLVQQAWGREGNALLVSAMVFWNTAEKGTSLASQLAWLVR
jgi:hypothetical protein